MMYERECRWAGRWPGQACGPGSLRQRVKIAKVCGSWLAMKLPVVSPQVSRVGG